MSQVNFREQSSVTDDSMESKHLILNMKISPSNNVLVALVGERLVKNSLC